MASGNLSSPLRDLGIQAVENNIFDVFMSKTEVLHSQIIFTVLLTEYFHGWKRTWMSRRFWTWNLSGGKEQSQPDIGIMSRIMFYFPFSLFLFSLLYLHSLFYFIWSFLYLLSPTKCLAVGDTTPRLWLQTVLVLLGNFFFLYFMWYFIFVSSLCYSPCLPPPPLPPHITRVQVEQDAQRNCIVSITGGFQDQTGETGVNHSSQVWHQSWPCLRGHWTRDLLRSFQPELTYNSMISVLHLIFLPK